MISNNLKEKEKVRCSNPKVNIVRTKEILGFIYYETLTLYLYQIRPQIMPTFGSEEIDIHKIIESRPKSNLFWIIFQSLFAMKAISELKHYRVNIIPKA